MTAEPPAVRVFDAHFHVIDARFPVIPNQGYLPPPFTVTDYVERVGPLGVRGGAVVAGSFQGHDQTWLLDALDRLGPSYVGVAQLPDDVSDDVILDLDRRGVRAARANLRRGMATFADVARLAARVHDVAGWHIELYADATELDPEHLVRLPHVVIDHLGLRAAGLPVVRRIAERGHHVKATGFGRGDVDVARTLRAIADVNPAALLFGTDLPSTRSPRPFADGDLDLLIEVLGPELAVLAIHDNAVGLYRPCIAL
jgi:predicted TIM-barrel fold metal-dependent hydrolase